MQRKRTVLVVALLALSLATGYALRPGWAQEEEQRNAIAQKRAREKAASAEDKPRMMQCPMMAGLRDLSFYADSPAVLLAQAEELGLTAKQKKQLEQIQAAARKRTRAVLTKEQRDQLQEAPKGRLSMMELSRMRMKKTTAKDDKGMMCPMCMKMMEKMRAERDKDEKE